MDPLPDLRQKNTNEGISGHCAGEIPAVLLHMQERNPNQCGADENGCKRRARRLEHTGPASPVREVAGPVCVMGYHTIS